MLASAAKETGMIAVSVPPMITSRRRRARSALGLHEGEDPGAQAATQVLTAPRRPSWMLI